LTKVDPLYIVVYLSNDFVLFGSFEYLFLCDSSAPETVTPIPVDDYSYDVHHNGKFFVATTKNDYVCLHDSSNCQVVSKIDRVPEQPGALCLCSISQNCVIGYLTDDNSLGIYNFKTGELRACEDGLKATEEAAGRANGARIEEGEEGAWREQ
jgi:hypothetical protein